MMMMMCNDLMCTWKLTRSQLSLAHSQTDEKKDRQWLSLHCNKLTNRQTVTVLRQLSGDILGATIPTKMIANWHALFFSVGRYRHRRGAKAFVASPSPAELLVKWVRPFSTLFLTSTVWLLTLSVMSVLPVCWVPLNAASLSSSLLVFFTAFTSSSWSTPPLPSSSSSMVSFTFSTHHKTRRMLLLSVFKKRL